MMYRWCAGCVYRDRCIKICAFVHRNRNMRRVVVGFVRQFGMGRRTSPLESVHRSAEKAEKVSANVSSSDSTDPTGGVEARRAARAAPRETSVTRLTWCMDMMVAVTHSTPVMPSVAGSWNIVAVHPRHTPQVGTPTRVPFRSSGPGGGGGGTAHRPPFDAVTRDPRCDRPSLVRLRRGGQVATGVCASRASLSRRTSRQQRKRLSLF